MNIDLLASSLKDSQAYIIISPENRRYFTDFDSSDGVLAVTSKESVFYTDSRYIENAQRTINCCTVLEGKNQFEQLDELFKKADIKEIKIEASRMTVARFNNFKSTPLMQKYTFTCDNSLDSLINSIRRKKLPDEIERIKKAQQIAEKAFEYVLGIIKPGITEKELQLALDFKMLSSGADSLSFETIVVSGVNSSMPHGVPSNKKVQKGEFITFDFGAVVEGYHSDMTRTVALGHATKEMELVYNTVLKAQLECEKTVKSGVPCSQADKAARDVIENVGYGKNFGHSTGHGVGVEIHEYPNLSPRSKEILKVGDVVTDEPGIYISGKFGVRIEDMLLVTETGCENLTHFDKNLIII